jgi:hypothetical protein
MKTSKNDVTGDSLKSRPVTEKFSKGFDGIDWSVKLETPVATPEIPSDKPLEPT